MANASHPMSLEEQQQLIMDLTSKLNATFMSLQSLRASSDDFFLTVMAAIVFRERFLGAICIKDNGICFVLCSDAVRICLLGGRLGALEKHNKHSYKKSTRFM